ncbi:small acid-soluble spore protein Tlp [Paenibacillus mendelii]|uniref:Small acid-soluble spore protein Tlp n=1 Tax=Paenibacillus mendelii TaxID=206163 RepID=A0ABV6J327_9BACL|nr:small acid-soluble spore protein Tlp [Paenibacillus mendelii]MCQ6562870.1 small acid-soluble spore protein Tlp [Paenibacillus mendelii]
MAKPDNRANNAERLHNAAENTAENLNEAVDYLDEHADEISASEIENIEAKNERREESIAGMKSEIEDEQQFQQHQQ